MTDDTKPAVDKNVDKPSVSPDKGPVDNTGKPLVAGSKWAFNTQPSQTVGMTQESKGVMLPQHEIPKEVDPLLVTMLCWPRDHNSPEELAFTGWVKDHLANVLKQEVMLHSEGAISVSIPLAPSVEGEPTVHSTTLFSCHLDTVDNKMNDPASRKKLTYDPSFGTIALDSQSVGNCLGADDSAGIWLMFKMIEAGTPGTYLFHRGEERGGISAKAIRAKESQWLEKFSVAVAFDRKDTGDIVTVQGGQRCASGKFAGRLAGMLDEFGFSYLESTTGSYTDVKDYRGVIAECVNLSCGYDSAHSRGETLDYGHLAAMAQALPKVAWESLPIDRDPKAKEPEPAWKRGNTWMGGNMGRLFDDEDEDRQWGVRGKKNGAKLAAVPPVEKFEDKGFDGMSMTEIEDVVSDDVTWTAEQIVRLLRENARLKADVATMSRLLGL